MEIPPALTGLQTKRPRRFPKVRFTLLIIGLILIGIGTILWFLSNAQVINAGLFNVLTIIFGVLSLAVGWIFGLFPSPTGETGTEPSELTNVSTNEQKLSFQEAQQVQPIQHVGTFNQNLYFLQPGQVGPVPQQQAFHPPIPQPESMAISQPAQTKEAGISEGTEAKKEDFPSQLPEKPHDNTLELAKQYYGSIMESKEAASYAYW